MLLLLISGGLGVLFWSVTMNPCSSSSPCGVVNCPLEVAHLYTAHQLYFIKCKDRFIVKSICCIISPQLPVGEGAVVGWGCGFYSVFNFFLLSFSVSRVMTLKLYVDITLKFESWHLM